MLDAFPSAGAYAAFLVASVALVLAPGPDTLLVLTQAARSRAAGIGAAVGVSAGVLLHTAAAALGLAALFAAAPGAAAAVRVLGGLYLCYLGVRTLRAAQFAEAGRTTDDGDSADSVASDAVGFRRGLAVNASNPQVALFFLAFLPGFVESGNPAGFAVLGGSYAALTAAYLCTVAVAADQAAAAVRSPGAGRLNAAAGVVLLAMGIWIVAAGIT